MNRGGIFMDGQERSRGERQIEKTAEADLDAGITQFKEEKEGALRTRVVGDLVRTPPAAAARCPERSPGAWTKVATGRASAIEKPDPESLKKWVAKLAAKKAARHRAALVHVAHADEDGRVATGPRTRAARGEPSAATDGVGVFRAATSGASSARPPPAVSARRRRRGNRGVRRRPRRRRWAERSARAPRTVPAPLRRLRRFARDD